MCYRWPGSLEQLMQWLVVRRCVVSWCRSILSAPNILIMYFHLISHLMEFLRCLFTTCTLLFWQALMSKAAVLRILDVLTEPFLSSIFICFCSVHRKSTCSVFMGELFHMTDSCLSESDLLDNSTCYSVGFFYSSLGSPCWLMLTCCLSPDCTLALRPVDVPVTICLTG